MAGDSIVKWALLGGAAYFGYKYFFATPAAPATPPASGSNGSGSGSSSSSSSSTTSTATSSYNTASALFDRVTAALKADNITTASPDVFDQYVMNQGGPGPLPDPVSLFGSHDPITFAQYWAKVSDWLVKNKGLTGFGIYAGLGRLAFGARR